ncbi:phosphatidate cytidylyltransferase [Variovorax guangxiensis]|uniref:Phosphatidate cytidylyltransferase n=1 Tax=Variovorax guangxiensis TaxID=1775474 RepID=A0A502DTF5_9BURK|nr:phosphatidate cytidylyltransferase [Variovorax guangxiensis]TPG24393.1 phosphatidate cytidylyltransferase [Variovorax ginsengisoli]TPG28643.1 phosphatidate cytidylyltransferase [Variovorax guangxiensis]
MNAFLRNLTPTQQVAALFLIVFGVLTVVSIGTLLVGFRERRNAAHGEAWLREFTDFRALLRTTWFMVVVFWIGWALGPGVATLLFAFIAFFALREFITLSPTRRGDHRSLILAFFVVLPVQFILVGTARFDLFTVFIPVYVFIAIPVVSALANDPSHFLERNAKLQWGIMVCVYGMSHVPALLLLSFPDYEGKSAFLVFFLVFVVQTCMVVQHLIARRYAYLPADTADAAPSGPHGTLQRWLAREPFAPNVSRSFNWVSWGVGMAIASVVGALLSFITPFKFGQALAMALIACVTGSMGHLVMKALKRDRGIPNWGQKGVGVTGANGLLDRVDALCFAAPIFFHSVRWYFGV